MLTKGNTGLVSTQQHGLDVGRASKYSERRNRKEGCRRVRQRPEPVPALRLERVELRPIRLELDPVVMRGITLVPRYGTPVEVVGR